MYLIKSKRDSNTIAKTCYSLKECKKWFANYCDTAWTWEVHTPDGTILDGRLYQSW